MNKLIFNVSREWYDLYRSGAKREEYRAITPRWESRLYEPVLWPPLLVGLKKPKRFDIVEIRCGYPSGDGRPETPNLQFRWIWTETGYAKADIGAKLMGDEKVFVIKMEDL